MPKRLDRAKIVKLVRESKPGKFNPSINEVLFWYDNLNSNLFEEQLPLLTGVKFCRTKDYWAETCCHRYKDGTLKNEITLSPHFKSFKDFVEVIAHEMIHIWEYDNFSVMGHGERFFSWEHKLKRFGLNLSEKQ